MTTTLSATLAPEVQRAQQGDVHAFTRLVEKTSTMVCSLAFVIVRDPEASEDIAQEVYLAAWKGLHRLKNTKSFLPWLRQMTRNQANTWMRKVYSRRENARVREELLATVADPTAPAHDQLERREELELISRALDEISDEAREVLVLYYREGRSTSQVADLLGLSKAAVRKRLSRARRQIREDLADQIRRGVERTAPGLSLATSVLASMVTMTGPASALGIGSTGAGYAAGTTKALGSFQLGLIKLASALPGVLGGIGGVVFGLRREFAEAIDARETEDLRRFRNVAVSVVVAAGIAFVQSTRFEHWVAPTAVYLVFLAVLGLLYHVWLPRITRRRREYELVNDPQAAHKHRRQQILAWVGYLAGAICGGLGLLAGLWFSGYLN